MWLCDIGNTNVALMHCDTKEVRYIKAMHFNPKLYDETVYYISVNSTVSEQLKAYKHYIDMASWVTLEAAYETLGVDRKLLAWYIHDGVVIDAGSAITVDAVQKGVYKGGFITLGMAHMQEAFSRLSPALNCSFNFELALDIMPQTTQDAITYGALAPLVAHLQKLCKNQTVICTGGDGAFFAHHLNSTYQPQLIFDAMRHLLQQKEHILC